MGLHNKTGTIAPLIQDGFPGLVSLIKEYLDDKSTGDVHPTSKAYIMKVLKFISMKASGWHPVNMPLLL